MEDDGVTIGVDGDTGQLAERLGRVGGRPGLVHRQAGLRQGLGLALAWRGG